MLVARRHHLLEELAGRIAEAGGESLVLEADLSIEAERARVIERTRSVWGAVDVLVNNAGIGWYGYAADMPWAVAHQMLQVNVSTVAHLTLLVLPEMRQRNAGHIINIGSIAGTMGAQGVALYGGTKSFLTSFSRAICREMHGSGVQVSLVQVGIAAGTEFYDSAVARPGSLRMPAGRGGVNPQKIARRVSALIRRPRKVVYVPWILGALAWVELLFGWVLDLAGPLHLRTESMRTRGRRE